MNETLKTIASRYSCRAFTGEAVDRELLEKIALAAVQSPSATNRQCWEIVVITDKQMIEDMDNEGMEYLKQQEDQAVYQRFVDRGGKLFYDAPCMFLILIKPGTELDCGIVSENIALAASSLGLGNVICGMAAVPFSSKNGESFRRCAGLNDDMVFGMAVLVGREKTSGEPHEPDLSKIRFI